MGEQRSESAKAGEGGRFGATGCRVLVVRGGQKRLHWPGSSSEGQSDLGVRTLSPRILVLQGQEAQEHLLGSIYWEHLHRKLRDSFTSMSYQDLLPSISSRKRLEDM